MKRLVIYCVSKNRGKKCLIEWSVRKSVLRFYCPNLLTVGNKNKTIFIWNCTEFSVFRVELNWPYCVVE